MDPKLGSSLVLETEVALCDSSLVDNNYCAVCLCSIDKRAQLHCSHVFCHECISAWAQTKRSCPLCNTEFTLLKIYTNNSNTFTEEAVPAPCTRKSADLASDLEALDHTYFLEEARRLLSIAEEAQRSIVRSQKQSVQSKFGSKFQDSWEARNWDLLENIVARLQVQIELFHSDQRLDPGVVLGDLYDIQSQMNNVWRAPKQQPAIASNNERYGADDYNDLSSEDEDDDYDDYDGGRGYKKDRKPNNRAPKKPQVQRRK